ncbi:N-6 DNA methylase [Nonomuraea sp. SYSU D8015]|uniref:N-6 DNA methylase n=1 Tax=Nonomuraea sp. SYSU D8015 TaxID=2593644 RepID=UPI001660CF19|nr:N-6 DNA methylase [Nonomuraea sp. SYSU D8015]
MIPTDAFAPYSSYNDELLTILQETETRLDSTAVAAHLDGMAYQRLRRGVSVQARRANSTFFTGTQLRTKLLSPYSALLKRGISVMDPACGAGDLLIGAISLLPKTWTSSQIIDYVDRSVFGIDKIGILAEVARNRLKLALKARAGIDSMQNIPELKNIRQGDGLEKNANYSGIRLILLNPPFARVSLPEPQSWGEGLASQAAPFTLEVLRRSDSGTRIATVLPDVLRSGSRYARWRAEVEQVAKIIRLEPVGLFDPWTDVDVFIAHFQRKTNHITRHAEKHTWYERQQSTDTRRRLGDVADISIGDVVPHRHAVEGPLVPYLTVQDVPVGATVTEAPKRHFNGRLHKAPFLVLRRTSAPTRTPGKRLSVSIIDASLGEVAVENHLVIVKPKDLRQLSCARLKRLLEASDVTSWLDERIRTRHLTKTALLDLPLALCDDPSIYVPMNRLEDMP